MDREERMFYAGLIAALVGATMLCALAWSLSTTDARRVVESEATRPLKVWEKERRP